MRDLLAIPAVWGLCGGLLSGLHGLVTAYSRKAGTPEARQTAWLRLGFGIVAGPIAAQAMTPSVLALIPALAMEVVAVGLGWGAANDPRGLFEMVMRMIRAGLQQEEPKR